MSQSRISWKSLALAATLVTGSLHAQATYHLSRSIDGPIIAGSMIGLSLDWQWRSQMQAFSASDLQALDPSQVPVFDRYALGRWSPSAGEVSDVALIGALGLGASSSLHADNLHQFLVIGVMWAEANMVTGTLTDMTKHLVHRARPYAYGALVPSEIRMDEDARRSFFSGHTSVSACNLFFAAKILADQYPEHPLKPWVWATAAIIPAYTGYQRIRAGEHFPSDVIVGYAVGALIGYMMPVIHLD